MNKDYEYQYNHPSVIESGSSGRSFLLAHCSEIEEDRKVPCFFYGNIINSFIASRCLSVMGKTTRSHFAITPLQRFGLRDPIVSIGNGELRFESFSSCNSVYARMDVFKDGIDGEFIRTGCTNVDFNDLTVRAFNSVSRNEKLVMGIGSKVLKIITEKISSSEKKVSLPDRWIRGLGNVQVYLSQMELAFRLNKIEALQLFKNVPKTPVKEYYYLYKNGNSYNFSPVTKSNSLKIGGIHRFNLFENLLIFTEFVSFYKNEDEQSMAVILDFKDIQMLFLFSDNVFRGFSGEGKNNENLIQQIPDEWLIGINNFFRTNEIFNPAMVSIEHDIQFRTMDTMQSSLSSMGLLGYDLNLHNYFYRKLPFKLSRLKSLNPRVQNALKLVNRDEVRIQHRDENSVKAEVKGTSDIVHTVIGNQNIYKCTCTWFTIHHTERGLCKHILAVKIKLDEAFN
jgi:hypothetical protein